MTLLWEMLVSDAPLAECGCSSEPDLRCRNNKPSGEVSGDLKIHMHETLGACFLKSQSLVFALIFVAFKSRFKGQPQTVLPSEFM